MSNAKTYPKSELDRLNADPEFQRRVATDELLEELLNSRPTTPDEIRSEMLTILGGHCQIGEIVFAPPTPGIIAMLDLAKSPFISAESNEIRGVDIDVAFRILITGRDAFEDLPDLEGSLEVVSMGMCEKFKLSYGDVAPAIFKVLRTAFAGFEMTPANGPKSEKNKNGFDADWLSALVAAVSNVTHLTPDEIIWRTPMTSCSYYCMQNLRKLGVRDVGHRIRGREAMDRLREMMDQRLEEYKRNV